MPGSSSSHVRCSAKAIRRSGLPCTFQSIHENFSHHSHTYSSDALSAPRRFSSNAWRREPDTGPV